MDSRWTGFRSFFEMWFDKLTTSGGEPLTLSPSKSQPEPAEGPEPRSSRIFG